MAAMSLMPARCARKSGDDFPCTGKEFTIGTHRYCARKEYVTWHEAKKRCDDAGGYLLVVNSEEENEAIWEILGGTWEHSAWIGFTDGEVEGSWKWISGEAVKYGNWRPGLPDNHQTGEGDEDCGEWLSEDGGWNDISCGVKTTYLCKSIAGRKKEFMCTGKLFTVGDFDYCAIRTWVDWHAARKSCEVNGGLLASIISEEENAAIFRHLGASWGYSGNLWIGLVDAAKEGDFRWINGEAVTYGNWCTGEPNDAGKVGEDCAHIFTSRNCWNDSDCNARFGYVCERGD